MYFVPSKIRICSRKNRKRIRKTLEKIWKDSPKTSATWKYQNRAKESTKSTKATKLSQKIFENAQLSLIKTYENLK